jgi:ABC-type Fe3+/spermidine/putrescine transport system ATPase subunit
LPGPAAATIKTVRLSRRFRVSLALDGVSLDIPAGRITVVLGAAGAGKTALMRVLAGLDRPQAGRLELNGLDITKVAPRRRGFGVVRQPDMLFPRLSIAENVALPLRLRGVGRADRARLTDMALELMGIADLAAMPARAAVPDVTERGLLARAISTQPRVLLLDEPFAPATALNPMGAVSLLRRAQALLANTMVVATRYAPLALGLADQIAVLRTGTLEQAGPPDEVFNRPRSQHVAGLSGEVNRLPGKVEALQPETVSVRLACGPLVEASRGGAGLEEGKPCTVVVRPNSIALATVPARDMGEGALEARLLETQFLGDSYMLRLLIGSGAELVVHRPALGGLRGLAPGRSAAVAWQTHQAFAFREGGED